MTRDPFTPEQLRDRMGVRVRTARLLAQRISRNPDSQLEYIEDLSTLLKGQAKDAARAALILDRSANPAGSVMDNYADVLVAANDPVTGGHNWALIERAAGDELSFDARTKFAANEGIRTTKAASREAALMSWMSSADTETVDRALEDYWSAYNRQTRDCTIDLGEVGKKYDRTRLVTGAWETVTGERHVAERVRTRSEEVNFLLDDPDSPRGEAAAKFLSVDRDMGITQCQGWNAVMGRDRTPTVTGTQIDRSLGPVVTGARPDSGLDR